MYFSVRKLARLCTGLAALTLLSGCAEVISFTAGFGAGFFAGQYYAESESEDDATMRSAMARQQQQAMMGGQPQPQGGPAQDYAYAPQQQQAPLPYNDPYYGMAPNGYPGGYAAPAPAPAYPAYPAAPAPAYGAPPPAYGAPAPGSVYVPPPMQPAPSSYVTPGYGYDQNYRYQAYSY